MKFESQMVSISHLNLKFINREISIKRREDWWTINYRFRYFSSSPASTREHETVCCRLGVVLAISLEKSFQVANDEEIPVKSFWWVAEEKAPKCDPISLKINIFRGASERTSKKFSTNFEIPLILVLNLLLIFSSAEYAPFFSHRHHPPTAKATTTLVSLTKRWFTSKSLSSCS